MLAVSVLTLPEGSGSELAFARRASASRECLGHHRKGTPGIGNDDYVLNVR